jgi:hypothetical protein
MATSDGSHETSMRLFGSSIPIPEINTLRSGGALCGVE